MNSCFSINRTLSRLRSNPVASESARGIGIGPMGLAGAGYFVDSSWGAGNVGLGPLPVPPIGSVKRADTETGLRGGLGGRENNYVPGKLNE
jgi:hypothetical protein